MAASDIINPMTDEILNKTIKRGRGRPKKVVCVDRKEYLHSYYKNHYSPSFNPDAKIGRPTVPDEQRKTFDMKAYQKQYREKKKLEQNKLEQNT